LVFKIYESAGIELCDKHTFRDYDLSSESARRAIEKRYNTDINLEEEVVTPEDLFESSAFYEVFDNY
jgi:hypothetical protein